MNTKLRVWWIPQVPMEAFHVDVPDLKSAYLILKTLADYDAFQYDHNVKPDYCNAGGLQMWDELENEWIDWMDEDTGMEFDEYVDEYGLESL